MSFALARLASSSVRRWSAPLPSTALRSWIFRIWPSTLTQPALVTTNLVTTQGLVWPMRWTRAAACSSTAAFHHGSMMKAWLALVRFRPCPPAFRLASITRTGRCSQEGEDEEGRGS